ncbi:MAG TPA: hypothetical protein VG847_04210 [Chitinophagaceae bacterium]|nr:hypothetical protein [Chitinophagaceae bacterium]
MKTTICVRDTRLELEMEEFALHLTINHNLRALLARDTEAATDEVVAAMKAAYHQAYSKNFTVSDASMAVEIWAHIYVEKFAIAIRSLNLFDWADKLANIAIGHAEVIDIGEEGHDNNRFIWNGLSVFRKAIAAFLPTK